MNRWSTIVTTRPLLVLLATIIVVLGGGAWGVGVFDRLSLGGYTDPGSESAYVENLVAEHFGRQVPDLSVRYTARDGETIDDLGPEVAARLAELDPELMATPPLSYWSAPPLAQAFLRSTDGNSALVVLALNGTENSRINALSGLQEQLTIDGTNTEFSGFSAVASAYNEVSRSDLVRAEMFSFPVLLLLLLVIFGSLVGAAVPLCIGGLAIAGSLAALRGISYFTEVSAFSVNIASLVGLGMSIDYGLFIVTRFREELRAGRSVDDAVTRTMATAGRTVSFSALLLVCAFLGMLVFPQAIIRSFAFGGIAALAISAALAMTALPAALMLLGNRINSLSWRAGVIERSEDRAARVWGGIATWVMRRPAVIATSIIALLLVLTAPVFGASLGELDHNGLPAGHEARTAVDDLMNNFPIANNGATVVVRTLDGSAPSLQATGEVIAAVNATEGVRQVVPTGVSEDLAAFRAAFTTPDRSVESMATVDRLREIPAPEGTEILLGGLNALTMDGLDAMAQRLPWMFLVMVSVTFIVMLMAFRSIVLPIKAIAMAALSLGATFGILTWVFQDGHGAHLFGVTPGPLPGTMVILIIAVVFGLSTDYEIFLLSRMVEAHEQGADTEEAVRIGIARTGRIVTAAAALLIVVTAAFTLSELTMMRFVGIGMIVALIIDATIVRMLLVPALVKLMGPVNWWSPRILARKNNHISDSKFTEQQGISVEK